MSIYGIDMGHPDNCGAKGFMSETEGNRAVGRVLMAKLKALGHTVVDCTIYDNNNELARRVAKANAQRLDYFISLHLDSYNVPSANGATIYTTANSGAKSKAQEIINLVAASCNYHNRGLKFANFYVLSNTTAPAMLIEMGFVSNKEDCNKFNAESLANAIVKGLTGQTVTPVVVVAATPKPNVTYAGHVEGIGWQDTRRNGETAGTTGESKRLEGLTMDYDGPGHLEFQCHVQNIGWQSARQGGEIGGTIGKAYRIEAIAIALKDTTNKVTYRVHVEGIGWGPWIKDGEIAGTVGESKRIEAIEIKIV